MKAIGEIQPIGGAHFVERPALLCFVDAMIAAPSVEEGLRLRLLEAEPAPRQKALRVSVPADLRSAMLPDLPANTVLSPGRLEIAAPTAMQMLESLVALAMVMQNDLDSFRDVIEPQEQPTRISDVEIHVWLQRHKGLAEDFASASSTGSSS